MPQTTRSKPRPIPSTTAAPTKLDKKIEKMKAMMGSTVQKVPAVKPTASKFVDYKGVNKLPMQGGACTPK